MIDGERPSIWQRFLAWFQPVQIAILPQQPWTFRGGRANVTLQVHGSAILFWRRRWLGKGNGRWSADVAIVAREKITVWSVNFRGWQRLHLPAVDVWSDAPRPVFLPVHLTRRWRIWAQERLRRLPTPRLDRIKLLRSPVVPPSPRFKLPQSWVPPAVGIGTKLINFQTQMSATDHPTGENR